MSTIKSKSYTLRAENGEWLGQIVLTSDGMFAGVTDYGNLSFAWRGYSNNDGDFREFLTSLNAPYFAQKMVNGMAYIAHSAKIEKACKVFTDKILPPLQSILRQELNQGIPWE